MNLHILTEERPKREVLKMIIERFLSDKGFCAFIDNIRILPIIQDRVFIFLYELEVKGKMILGLQAPKVFAESLKNLFLFWNLKC